MDRTGLQSGLHHGLLSGLNPLRKQSVSIPMEHLKLWLKVYAGITKDGSNYVSLWADQSGNGNDFSQNTGSAQGLWLPNQVNGKPALRLDGSNDKMDLASVLQLTQLSAFFVAKNTQANQYSQFIFGPKTTLNKGRLGYYGQYGIVFETSSAMIFNTTHYTLSTAAQYYTGEFVWDGGQLKTYMNGEFLGTDNVGGTFTLGDIGYDGTGGGGQWFTGDLGEIILYDAAKSDTDRVQVENYFKKEYIHY